MSGQNNNCTNLNHMDFYTKSKRFVLTNNDFMNNFANGHTLRTDYGLQESKSCIVSRSFNSHRRCLSPDELEKKFASVKIFSTVLLKAWRRRRNEVKQLVTKIDDLKKGTMKSKNQIHVYNTLFRVEQRRNDELTCQLKRSMEGINQARSSCESLTTSIISLKADKALLEQELRTKFHDLEALNEVLSQTKNELTRSLMEHRHLQSNLKKEQRTVQMLEAQKDKLINEVVELGTENRKLKEEHINELKRKSDDIQKANSLVFQLEQDIETLREKSIQLEQITETDARLKSEVSELQKELVILKESMNESINCKLRLFWERYQHFRTLALQLMHIIAYILLPATPAPKFAFTLNRNFPSLTD